jgi:hypothetical protein
MAQQFALVGGGEFKIPFMSDNIGGFKVGERSWLVGLFLQVRCPTAVAGSHQLKY